ncbi:hypothetical protein CAXC1_110006 [Candidatus Xenohaliotis californiensis]|uniref:Uncharacterized protein n=1 Tax=Candidatus Xenohaliotis californiensis TaxID=84677 RepID=A0ABP0ERP6_9RICK|nr:hypothetical protein CAXC1_110006 [Candidatus Xenohaliotis californiensis]
MNLVREDKKEKWEIQRFITMGCFHFAHIAIYHDLDSEKWPDSIGILSNEIVQKLLIRSDDEFDDVHATDYDIDTLEVEKIVPLPVASADDSQYSALVDVMKGHNTVIHGPPLEQENLKQSLIL